MKLIVNRTDLWTATIDDQAGGAAEKLEPLAKAGANFEFVFARRTPEQPGMGTVFVWPIKGAKLIRAAQEAGFAKSGNIHGLRIEGANEPGLVAKIARALADAGINFRGLSAAALGRKFVSHLALDSPAHAGKAASVLKNLS
jgi:hypothetical protein